MGTPEHMPQPTESPRYKPQACDQARLAHELREYFCSHLGGNTVFRFFPGVPGRHPLMIPEGENLLRHTVIKHTKTIDGYVVLEASLEFPCPVPPGIPDPEQYDLRATVTMHFRPTSTTIMYRNLLESDPEVPPRPPRQEPVEADIVEPPQRETQGSDGFLTGLIGGVALSVLAYIAIPESAHREIQKHIDILREVVKAPFVTPAKQP